MGRLRLSDVRFSGTFKTCDTVTPNTNASVNIRFILSLPDPSVGNDMLLIGNDFWALSGKSYLSASMKLKQLFPLSIFLAVAIINWTSVSNPCTPGSNVMEFLISELMEWRNPMLN